MAVKKRCVVVVVVLLLYSLARLCCAFSKDDMNLSEDGKVRVRSMTVKQKKKLLADWSKRTSKVDLLTFLLDLYYFNSMIL